MVSPDSHAEASEDVDTMKVVFLQEACQGFGMEHRGGRSFEEVVKLKGK